MTDTTPACSNCHCTTICRIYDDLTDAIDTFYGSKGGPDLSANLAPAIAAIYQAAAKACNHYTPAPAKDGSVLNWANAPAWASKAPPESGRRCSPG